MKAKCPECGSGKARRLCHRAGAVEICSACCATMRDPECGDCPHYADAKKYEANRFRKTGLGPDDFLMEINPEVSRAVDRALQAAERGELKQPMEELKALLRDHPRHHDVSYGIGVIHAVRGEIQESIEWFDRAIAINPFSLEAHFNRAVSFEKLLDLLRCLRGYQKVVSIGPVDDPVVVQARSLIRGMANSIRENHGVELEDYLRGAELFEAAFKRMEAEDWSGALESFRASTALNDTIPSCHGNMGLCHAYLGHKAAAIAAFDRALEIDPHYEPARSNREVALGMVEGKPLESASYESINFAEEKLMRRRSTSGDATD